MDRAKQTPVKVMKSHTVTLKALAEDSGEPPGTFTALVSVFGNKDFHGDTVVAGAFTRTLHEWALKERPIPVVWSHMFHDLDAFLGEYLSVIETEKGLEVKGKLDLNHPKAARAWELMERGLIAEFSWSGEVREYELEENEDSFWPSMKILDVDLWEAGPTFKGANPETELLSIKADGRVTGELTRAKAGRVLSADNYAKLEAVRDQIDEVLKAATPAEEPPVEDEPAGDNSTVVENGLEPAKLDSETDSSGGPSHVEALLELATLDPMEGN